VLGLFVRENIVAFLPIGKHFCFFLRGSGRGQAAQLRTKNEKPKKIAKAEDFA
jgi:hypothetical protein